MTRGAATLLHGAAALLLGAVVGLALARGGLAGGGSAAPSAGAKSALRGTTGEAQLSLSADVAATTSPSAQAAAHAPAPEPPPAADEVAAFTRLHEALRRLGPLLPEAATDGIDLEELDPARDLLVSGAVRFPDGGPAEGALIRARWDVDDEPAESESSALDVMARALLAFEREAAQRTAIARSDRAGRYELLAPSSRTVLITAERDGVECLLDEGAPRWTVDPDGMARLSPGEVMPVSFIARLAREAPIAAAVEPDAEDPAPPQETIRVRPVAADGEPARQVRLAALTEPDAHGRSNVLDGPYSTMQEDESLLVHLGYNDARWLAHEGQGWVLVVKALEGEARLSVPAGTAAGAAFTVRLGAPEPRGDLRIRLVGGEALRGRLYTRLFDREHARGVRRESWGEAVPAEGTVAYERVPAGAAELLVQLRPTDGAGSVTDLARYPLAVAPGEATIELALPVVAGTTLRAPSRGAVALYRRDDAGAWTCVFARADLDAEGRISLPLPDGEYAACFSPAVVAPAPEGAPRAGRRDVRFRVPLEGASLVRLPE